MGVVKNSSVGSGWVAWCNVRVVDPDIWESAPVKMGRFGTVVGV